MALQVKVYKKFTGFELDVDFEADGGCVGILGASGCGKSMTLKCIAGIEKPDSGRIVLNGRVLFDSEKKINLSAQERKVGYLFQNYALFPTMTVEDNLKIVMHGKDKQVRVKEQLRRFRLEGLEKRYPGQLSGGQQQRAALARMLLYQPEIIMLDEPFSAMDGFLKDTLQLELLELIKAYEGDVLMVSHSRDEIFKFCERMVLIEAGASILKGNTAEIFENPRKMEAAKLTGCKNISRVKKISDYEIMALDWDIKLHTKDCIESDISYVGIRGHHLRPVPADGAEKEENVMRIEYAGYSETPFEQQHLFRNADSKNTERIWWMCKKESFAAGGPKVLPEYIKFPKEHLMLLT